MAQLKEGSIIRKPTGDEIIATLDDIPVNTSDITNDSGYITANDVPEPKLVWEEITRYTLSNNTINITITDVEDFSEMEIILKLAGVITDYTHFMIRFNDDNSDNYRKTGSSTSTSSIDISDTLISSSQPYRHTKLLIFNTPNSMKEVIGFNRDSVQHGSWNVRNQIINKIQIITNDGITSGSSIVVRGAR